MMKKIIQNSPLAAAIVLLAITMPASAQSISSTIGLDSSKASPAPHSLLTSNPYSDSEMTQDGDLLASNLYSDSEMIQGEGELPVRMASPSTSETLTNAIASSDVLAKKKAAKAINLKVTLTSQGECFGPCVSSFGVSPMSVLGCAASCATGNVPICAVCVGVGVTAVSFCFAYCSVYGSGYGLLLE